jgi:uncharacterized lipoprotein
MACLPSDCCVGDMRCSGIAVVAFVVLLLLYLLNTACRRRRVVQQVKEDNERQQTARDLFASQLAAGLGSLTMDGDTIRAAHKGLGAISPEIRVRQPALPSSSPALAQRAERFR